MTLETIAPAIREREVSVGVVCPWLAKPYALVSWWDMERFSAAAFYRLTNSLHGMRNAIKEDIQERRAGAWDQSIILHFQGLLMDIEASCESLELKVSAKAAEFAALVALGEDLDHGRVVSAMEHLERNIQWEMEDRLFFYVPTERTKFYDQPDLFGPEVTAKFPSIQYDLAEAGNCFATGRGTACVFHLMRIMEVGVQEFGTKLGVSLANEKNWQNVLDETNKAIKNLPHKASGTVEMSQAAANLYSVKLAWRNEVMHPNDKYTLEESKNVFDLVKQFMVQLASII